MNRTFKTTLVVALLAGGLTFSLSAAPSSGEVDFGKFALVGKDTKFVEVNVKGTLISLAAKLVEEDEPDVAKLLRSVKLVRVNVIGLDEKNGGDMEKRTQDIRTQLDKGGWERIVAAQEQGSGDVGVYVKMRGEEAIEGLVVIAVDGNKKEAVFVNIVGDIRPDQVAAVGKALDIDPLKKAGESLKK